MSTQSHLHLFLAEDTDTYEDRPSLEEGHSKACLANATLSAVQNFRDDEGITEFDFSIWLQEGGPKYTALGYLSDGLSDCLCPPKVRTHRHYWTLFFHVASGGSYKSELFCTLDEAIMEAEEGRALHSDIVAVAVGRTIYAFDDLTLFWTSLDYGQTGA